MTETDEFGKKIERRRGLEPVRLAFAQSCTMYADPTNTKIISLEQLKRAFNTCYLLPAPSDSDYRRLVKSLEAWYDEDREKIIWGKILDAPTHRESKSQRGIFPKMLVKTSDLAER